MPSPMQQLEKQVFDRLNSLVVPLLMEGIGSSNIPPASLVVLESTGHKSGKTRKTPMWSLKLGRCRLVGTARGKRSFWVKNLYAQGDTRYFIAGEQVAASAIVLAPHFNNIHLWDLNGLFSKISALLNKLVSRGWAFAILVPQES